MDNNNSNYQQKSGNIFEDEIKISDYLAIIYRFKFLVFFIFAIVAIGSYYYTSKQPRIYSAGGKILLEENKGGSELLMLGSMGNNKTSLNNNIQIIQSTPVMVSAAQKLVQSNNFNQFSLPSSNIAKSSPLYDRYIRSIAGAMKGRFEIESIRETDVLTLSYESESPAECAEAINALEIAFQEETTRYARLEFTQIREFLEERVKETKSFLENSEQQLRDFKKANQISELSPASQKLVEQAGTFEADMHTAMTDSLLKATEIQILQRKITNQNIILNDLYIKDRDLTRAYQDSSATLSNEEQLELAKAQNLFEEEVDEDFLIAGYDEPQASVRDTVSIDNILNNSLINNLISEIVTKERYLIVLSSKSNYQEDHPELVNLNEELSNLKRELKAKITETVRVNTLQDPFSYRSQLIERLANVESEYEIVSSKLVGLRETVQYYQEEMDRLPDQELELSKLTRDKLFNEKIHTIITEKYEDAKIAEISQIGNVRILEVAGVPDKPIKPKKMMNYLIGVILGLGLGIGSAFLAHSLDTKLRTVEDIENQVNSPIYGTIPLIDLPSGELDELNNMISQSSAEQRPKLQQSLTHITGQLISHYSPKSPIAESYRSLRTNIIANKQPGSMSILVTSSEPKEGKSTTSSNLAITLAQMNNKVVIIDIDMRRPTIHTKFGLKKDNGSSDYLIDDTLLVEDVVKKSGIPNLDVVTSGFIPPNPSELLSSERMDQFIRELESIYDYVIFDSPPVIAVTDAIIMSKKVDKLLLVLRVAFTEKAVLTRANEILANVDKKVDGFIVNGIKVQKYYNRHKYYYYYYYYYYGQNEHKKKSRNIFSFLRKN
jgi:tyrosine-protein kinase Etk/Wzc